MIKKGDLVEFHRNQILFGVAVEDGDLEGVKVMMADRTIVTAINIYAFAWAGWIPEGLEVILEELNPTDWSEE